MRSHLLILLCLPFVLFGCGGGGGNGGSSSGIYTGTDGLARENPKRDKACSLPSEVELTIDVHDFLVKSMSMALSNRCIPNGLRFAERLFDGTSIYFKLVPISERRTNDYYLVKIPPVRDGKVDIIASLYDFDNLSHVSDPPQAFPVAGEIEKGYLVDLVITDLSWSPSGFITRGSGISDGDTVILDVESKNYPGSYWKVRLPTVDGKFTAVARLQ